MEKFYHMTIAGCECDLPLCPVNEDLMIAGFVIFNDVKITCACAKALLERAPEFDYIVAPEAKAISLAYEMARQSGRNEFIVIRKQPKAYMQGVFKAELESITTKGTQTLYMDLSDALKIKGKRILLLDDVISTGESLRAVEEIVEKAEGEIVAKMFILAEGDAAKRDDIIYLEPLPLFDKNGEPVSD